MADKNRKELVKKVGAHVRAEFGGDYNAAFNHYAKKRSAEPTVDADELKDLLAAAGVGNGFTRGMWVSEIIRQVDRDLDDKISIEEFQEVMFPSK